jgi:hypothetical protein
MKGEIKDAYPILSYDSYASCQIYIENKYLENGTSIPWWI